MRTLKRLFSHKKSPSDVQLEPLVTDTGTLHPTIQGIKKVWFAEDPEHNPASLDAATFDTLKSLQMHNDLPGEIRSFIATFIKVRKVDADPEHPSSLPVSPGGDNMENFNLIDHHHKAAKFTKPRKMDIIAVSMKPAPKRTIGKPPCLGNISPQRLLAPRSHRHVMQSLEKKHSREELSQAQSPNGEIMKGKLGSNIWLRVPAVKNSRTASLISRTSSTISSEAASEAPSLSFSMTSSEGDPIKTLLATDSCNSYFSTLGVKSETASSARLTTLPMVSPVQPRFRVVSVNPFVTDSRHKIVAQPPNIEIFNPNMYGGMRAMSGPYPSIRTSVPSQSECYRQSLRNSRIIPLSLPYGN